LASLSARPEATEARRLGVRASGAGSQADGARGPTPPRLPSRDHQRQGPTAPGASSGSFSSGGLHGGSTLSVTAAARNLTPPETTRAIKLISLHRRALLLAFLLDRPG